MTCASPFYLEVAKAVHTPNGTVPSLLKWTGSKRSQASCIASYVPQHRHYFEPFLGGGALLYLLGRSGSTCGDLYEPLINFWILVRDHPSFLTKNYEDQWGKLQRSFPDYFYVVRDRFNVKQNPADLNFLMRTCVNGIVRFNSRGEFNNSLHLSRRGLLPFRFTKIVKAWSSKIQGVNFIHGDYEKSIERATSKDFIYFDPPYIGNKQRYTCDLDVERFFCVLEHLNKSGVKWALSLDGKRGNHRYGTPLSKELFRRHVYIASGHSPVSKVLNGPIEMVKESLYLNF